MSRLHVNESRHVGLPSSVAVGCSVLQCVRDLISWSAHTATHCNTLQHTSTHTLQHTASSHDPNNVCARLHLVISTHCNTLQHTATHCNTRLWVTILITYVRDFISTSLKTDDHRLVGSLKLKVSLIEYSLFYRALLQKRPIILRSLRIVGG